MEAIHYFILRGFAIFMALINLEAIFINRSDLLLSILGVIMFILYSSMALDCDIGYEKMKVME